jgi:Leucine-rich repeat (LRR) protein
MINEIFNFKAYKHVRDETLANKDSLQLTPATRGDDDDAFSFNSNPKKRGLSFESIKNHKRRIVVTGFVVVLLLSVILIPLLANKDDTAPLRGSNQEQEKSPDKSSPIEKDNKNTDEDIRTNNTAAPTAVWSSSTSTIVPSFGASSASFIVLQEASYTPERFEDVRSFEYMAWQWLELTGYYDNNENSLIQKYVLVLLDLQFHGGSITFADGENECNWFGITCYNQTNAAGKKAVKQIVWPQQNLAGTIPQDIALLERLQYLDLAENQLTGSIPESLYDMTNLQSLFLHDNMLVGTIGTSLSQLTNLEKVFLGQNAFTGVFPFQSIKSPLRWLSLYQNRFSGSFSPTNQQFRQMFYLDLGRNEFSGTLSALGNLVRLRHLHLDHNSFTGSLPGNLLSVGSGRLKQVLVNDNSFTGRVGLLNGNPNTTDGSMLATLELQNNEFDSFNSNLCRRSVANGGKLVVLRANCGLCSCRVLCDTERCSA